MWAISLGCLFAGTEIDWVTIDSKYIMLFHDKEKALDLLIYHILEKYFTARLVFLPSL